MNACRWCDELIPEGQKYCSRQCHGAMKKMISCECYAYKNIVVPKITYRTHVIFKVREQHPGDTHAVNPSGMITTNCYQRRTFLAGEK